MIILDRSSPTGENSRFYFLPGNSIFSASCSSSLHIFPAAIRRMFWSRVRLERVHTENRYEITQHTRRICLSEDFSCRNNFSMRKAHKLKAIEGKLTLFFANFIHMFSGSHIHSTALSAGWCVCDTFVRFLACDVRAAREFVHVHFTRAQFRLLHFHCESVN